jgi:hypothetical protein
VASKAQFTIHAKVPAVCTLLLRLSFRATPVPIHCSSSSSEETSVMARGSKKSYTGKQ